LLVAAAIGLGITQGELHYFGDEMRHAVTGAFFRDAYVDMPFDAPRQYVFDYYAKYPALGLIYWPPGFHMVEGVFFLLFGISVTVSRFTVLCYALLGVWSLYRVLRFDFPAHRAWLATLLFSFIPYVLLYSRVTMLEIPGVATCLLALYFWRRFERDGRNRDLWLTGLVSMAAMMTSQKSGVLAFIVAVHFLVRWRWDLLKRWQVWAAAAVNGAVVIAWYRFSLGQTAFSLDRITGTSAAESVFQLGHFALYPFWVPRQMGNLLAALAVLGILVALVRQLQQHQFLWAWLIGTELFFSLIQEKDLRHTMVWLPVLAYFAVYFVEEFFLRRRWALVAGGALVAYFVVLGFMTPRPKLWGVAAAAEYVVAQPESDVIYYQGFLNGNFIFHVRQLDPEKRRVVAREKQVVAIRIYEGENSRRVISTPQQVIDFFRQWGIRYAVVEEGDFIQGLAVVNETIRSGPFVPMREFTITTNNPQAPPRRLTVYRFTGELHRVDHVELPMLTIRDDIGLDFRRLAGQPWPPRR
jgi:hypothetical protein